MTSWELTNVYGRPSMRKPEEPYWPVGRHDPMMGQVQPIISTDTYTYYMLTKGNHLIKRGATKEQVDAMYQEWLKNG